MNASYPPELKGFHLYNMRSAVMVFMIPVISGAWAFYRQETYGVQDKLQTVLHWCFMVGVGLFMITILWKALISLPRCKKCGRKMRDICTISIIECGILGMQEKSQWRVVACPSCREEFRIPGLS